MKNLMVFTAVFALTLLISVAVVEAGITTDELTVSSSTGQINLVSNSWAGHTYSIQSRIGNSAVNPKGFAINDDDMGKNRLTIDQYGNVGIGTTSPEVKLDVSGIIYADDVLVDELGDGVMVSVKDLAGGGGVGPAGPPGPPGVVDSVTLQSILDRITAIENRINRPGASGISGK